MKVTVSILLDTPREHVPKLLNLQTAYHAACNQIVPTVMENRCWNRVALHNLVYKNIRATSPFGSQMVCNAIFSVCKAYKAKTIWEDEPVPVIQFRKHRSVHFDHRTFSIKENILSLYTLEGRIRIPMRMGPFQEKYFSQGVPKEAELMRISADRPVTSLSFDPAVAQKRLRYSPVIKEAKVKLIEPDTIYVDYTVRQPLAWLHDFENIALDEEGVPFPVSPFFSPKKLPEIYLGIRNFYWNRPLKEPRAELALTILQLLNRLSLQVKRLDVSKAFLRSLGRREVILILEEQGFTKALRLTPKNFAQELGNYLELRPKLPPIPQIIDLRIPQLAFIEERKTH